MILTYKFNRTFNNIIVSYDTVTKKYSIQGKNIVSYTQNSNFFKFRTWTNKRLVEIPVHYSDFKGEHSLFHFFEHEILNTKFCTASKIPISKKLMKLAIKHADIVPILEVSDFTADTKYKDLGISVKSGKKLRVGAKCKAKVILFSKKTKGTWADDLIDEILLVKDITYDRTHYTRVRIPRGDGELGEFMSFDNWDNIFPKDTLTKEATRLLKLSLPYKLVKLEKNGDDIKIPDYLNMLEVDEKTNFCDNYVVDGKQLCDVSLRFYGYCNEYSLYKSIKRLIENFNETSDRSKDDEELSRQIRGLIADCKGNKPYVICLSGNDDTSYSKTFYTLEELTLEISYLAHMQPINLDDDVLARGYYFSN